MAVVICLMCGKSADLDPCGYRFCDECFDVAEGDVERTMSTLQDALMLEHPDRAASWEREFSDEELNDERFWN